MVCLRRSYVCFVVIITLLAVPLHVSGGETVNVIPMAFGSIDLHPAGDTVIIDADSGSASPQAVGTSLVHGGRSGRITVRSDVVEHLDIIYPSSVTLTDGSHSLILSDIAPNSEYTGSGVDLPGGGATVDVHIGGKLVLPGNTTHGTYSGSMTVIFNYN